MLNVKQFFNSRAAVWDKVSPHDPDKLRLMLDLSDLKPGSVVLDVGCGTGILEPLLLERSPSKIIAVDFAENMIAEAVQKRSDPSIEYICCDLFDLTEIRCDNCFFVSAFPHFPDPEAALHHVSTLIKPGGRITISNIQGKQCGYTADILNPLLPGQGLVNLLRPNYRLDTIIDNRFMYLVSGTRLNN